MDSNLDFLPFLLQKYKNNNEFISLITLFFQKKIRGMILCTGLSTNN